VDLGLKSEGRRSRVPQIQVMQCGDTPNGSFQFCQGLPILGELRDGGIKITNRGEALGHESIKGFNGVDYIHTIHNVLTIPAAFMIAHRVKPVKYCPCAYVAEGAGP